MILRAELLLEQRGGVGDRLVGDVEGIGTSDAAAVMELSEAAFKSRLHRARMAVREELGPLLDETETKRGDKGSK